MIYPYSIDQNLLPHCDIFEEGGYTKEENKLINETRKILSDDSIQITSTAVRVPIEICHCLLYTSPSPRDLSTSRMPSSA